MAEEQSQDQVAMQQSQDQVPNAEVVTEETVEVTPQEETTIDVDGERIPLDELKKGYMRQKDYTHKTQALAEERRKVTQPPVDPEVVKAAEVLKQYGFATKEDLEMERLRQEDEKNFQRLMEANPELKKDEKKIRAIGMNSNAAWEDIIHEYGFKEKTALKRARTSDNIVGAPTPKTQPKPKSVREMSSSEFKEWKKANLKGSTF